MNDPTPGGEQPYQNARPLAFQCEGDPLSRSTRPASAGPGTPTGDSPPRTPAGSQTSDSSSEDEEEEDADNQPATRATIQDSIRETTTLLSGIAATLGATHQPAGGRSTRRATSPSASSHAGWEGPPHPKPPKRTGLRQHRPKERNGFRDDIRKQLRKLLTHGELNFDPTDAEAEVFASTWNARAPDGPNSCDRDRFRIYLGGRPTHAWNQSAARVFAEVLISDGETPYGEADRITLQHAFMVRLRSLIKDFRSSKSGISKQERDKANRRRERKAAHHTDILARLGVDGMSSDEEVNTVPYMHEYHVRYPRWRARSLGVFLHTIDRVHLLRREEEQGRYGNFPHLRVRPQDLEENDIYVEGKFVPQLPKNAYDPDWLRGRPRRQMQQYIRPEEVEHDFVHDPQIYAWLGMG
ncbi:SUN domain-containing protein 3 [Stygiomarasmius scandens]|uniref:SUN domain-containing protein 3 n=1 Tax=Marasmiellus scandens TaxID=2682957 RepID=A0ABR1IM23_9AGAR